jgi:hypothetical protein
MLTFSGKGPNSIGAPALETACNFSAQSSCDNADHTVAENLQLTSNGGVTGLWKRGFKGPAIIVFMAIRWLQKRALHGR